MAKSKQGQTEIIGLMVIVVLFIVIIMFYLAFSIRSQPKETIKQNLQASYMLDAILAYTPDCGGEVAKTIRDIVKKCDFAQNNEACSRPCKDLINDESKKIIALGDKKYSYGFTIMDKNKNLLKIAECNSNSKMVDFEQILGYEATLAICF